MTSLALRALVEADFKLLHRWLDAPHLRPFYMRDRLSLDDVIRKFSPRIGGSHPVHCVIAEEAGAPFGYAQWYLNRDFPDYGAAVIGKDFGVSIDYFIGDAAHLGRRLGSRMLRTLVSEVTPVLSIDDQVFYIGHDDRNVRAIRCTTRAGFIACQPFVERSTQCTLYVRDETGRGKAR